jgi:Flp pilus assembly CpaF family ATPase
VGPGNRIILIFGRKGSGKTTLARKMLETERRVIVLDTLNEYTVGKIYARPEDLAAEVQRRPAGPVKATLRIGEDEDFETACRLARALVMLCAVVIGVVGSPRSAHAQIASMPPELAHVGVSEHLDGPIPLSVLTLQLCSWSRRRTCVARRLTALMSLIA